jgi:hypothetical protein
MALDWTYASAPLLVKRLRLAVIVIYKHFYLERVGEASEIPGLARAVRSVRSKLTAPGQGERGWWLSIPIIRSEQDSARAGKSLAATGSGISKNVLESTPTGSQGLSVNEKASNINP